MKKLIAMLLLTAMLFTFAACCREDPEDAEDKKIVMLSGKTGTDFAGIYLELTGLENADGKTVLKTRLVNTTDYTVSYGEAFQIECRENDRWVSCQTGENLSFADVEHILDAKSTKEVNYDLTGRFDISAPGTYRITAECYIYEEGVYGRYEKVSLWAEFTMVAKLEAEAQYIRTDGLPVGVETTVIRTLEELQTYYEENKGRYYLGRRENPASDQTIGFLDACDRYDEEFFAENALIIVVLREPSSSIRHKVTGVTVPPPDAPSTWLKVEIESIVPEYGDDAMAGWHILIAVNKAAAGTNLNNVSVYYNGVGTGQVVEFPENGMGLPEIGSK